MLYPVELQYSKSHEWVKVEDGVTVVGISDFAQNALAEGDILGGLPIGEDGVLWCATEKVSRAQLDKAVSIVKEVLAK